jgi:hypothetical protein
MKYLNTYKLFESNLHTSSSEEIMEFFYDIEENGNVNIFNVWLDKDLKSLQRIESPGFYPGYIVSVATNFNNDDIDRVIEYLQNIKECDSKIKGYFDKSMISLEPNRSNIGYKFTFLDKNWKSIKWDENLICKDEFIRNPVNIDILGGVEKIINKKTYSITFRFKGGGIGKTKADELIRSYKEDLNTTYPNSEFSISENSETRMSKGGKRIIINSITVSCLGKKKI